MTPDPIVWVWRTLPKWTLDDDLANGMQPTEGDVKRAAEAALHNPKAVAAMVYPVGFYAGRWVALMKPSVGLLTTSGMVRWHDPVTGVWSSTESA